MRKTIVLAVATLFVTSLALAANNGNSGSPSVSGNAVAAAYVVVNPSLSVQSSTPSVNMGTLATGSATAMFTWRIDTNQESVNFYIEATNLYKGDDPTSTLVPPIAINLGVPAHFSADNANPFSSSTSDPQWTSTPGVPIPGNNGASFPTVASGVVCFESSQSGVFSQNVYTTITYLNTNAEQPQGQYGGRVRFTVLL